MTGRPYPTGVFPRGERLYVKVKVDGKWQQRRTGYLLHQVDEAVAFREMTQAQIDAGFINGVSVARYAARWLETRKSRGLSSYADDVIRVNKHLVPSALGKMPIDEVRPRHVRAWLAGVGKGDLAPRTVRNVFTVVSTMFRDAVIDEVIPHTPCVIRRGDLPSIQDKDPEWRPTAKFTPAEIAQLVGDQRIPADRRVVYALLFLTGCRFGEVAALRWRHFDPRLKPLSRLSVGASYSIHLRKEKSTKTRTPRLVPVSPWLQRTLLMWMTFGWPDLCGRRPTDDDLIVPSRQGAERNRSVKTAKAALDRDLKLLGLRGRRNHDARRTFRSLLADHGGSERAIDWIVYGRKASVSGRYDEPSWAALCEPVQKLRLRLPKIDAKSLRVTLGPKDRGMRGEP